LEYTLLYAKLVVYILHVALLVNTERYCRDGLSWGAGLRTLNCYPDRWYLDRYNDCCFQHEPTWRHSDAIFHRLSLPRALVKYHRWTTLKSNLSTSSRNGSVRWPPTTTS